VVLMHPLMVHSASHNGKRMARIITNPPVSLRVPFNFDRENPDDYSLVERKTLKELGKERLQGWRIKGEREGVVPERLKIQNKWLEEEKARLAQLNEKTGSSVRVTAAA